VDIDKVYVRDRFKVEQRVQIRQKGEKGDAKYHKQGKVNGIVVGIFEHFIVVDNGRYRESFSWIDIAIGRVEVKAVRAA